jgi:hypothetical protein
MKEDHLRYLGVPLVSTKLSVADCKTLLDRITNRIGSWTSKNLSFAGRLQLLSSVLYSLQVFWSGIFIFPKNISIIIIIVFCVMRSIATLQRLKLLGVMFAFQKKKVVLG